MCADSKFPSGTGNKVFSWSFCQASESYIMFRVATRHGAMGTQTSTPLKQIPKGTRILQTTICEFPVYTSREYYDPLMRRETLKHIFGNTRTYRPPQNSSFSVIVHLLFHLILPFLGVLSLSPKPNILPVSILFSI